MQNNKLPFLILFWIFLGCTYKERKRTIIIDNILTIDIPNEFAFKKQDGIDSYIFSLENKDGISFHGDISLYSNDLSEPIFPVFKNSLKDSILNRSKYTLDTTLYHFSETPEKDMEERIFSKQFYIYDTINGIIVKIIQPKIIGDGFTGLYIHELRNDENFVLYAKNLDSINHIKALQMFKTIKYK